MPASSGIKAMIMAILGGEDSPDAKSKCAHHDSPWKCLCPMRAEMFASHRLGESLGYGTWSLTSWVLEGQDVELEGNVECGVYSCHGCMKLLHSNDGLLLVWRGPAPMM